MTPCPAYLLLGSDPEPHDCQLTKGHDSPHRCDCGTEWEDR